MRLSLALPLLLALPAAAQTTLAISVDPSGAPSDGRSSNVRGTPDLRVVVWHSDATNLVAGDSNGFRDAFWRDTYTGQTQIVSVGDHGQLGDASSQWPTVSADARFVAFQSFASNLVPGDTNGLADVFVRDRLAGTTVCGSLGQGGAPADGSSRYPMISRDGRLLVFESNATNFAPGDTNGLKDIYLRDLVSGSARCLSLGVGAVPADGDSGAPTFSPDNTHVVFESLATNLVPGDTNAVQDIFVCDLASGALVRASEDANGVGADGPSYDPYLSLDGRWVIFRSRATNLVPGDTNAIMDIFVKDLQTGAVTRESMTWYGGQVRWDCYAPWITPDGRYSIFSTLDSHVVPGDLNGVSDLFLHDRLLGGYERVNLDYLGQESDGGANYPVPSDDASRMIFDSVGAGLAPNDTNGVRDVFLRERTSSLQEFCAGDGSAPTACPCGNQGQPGRGCENSAGTGGAHLGASGATRPDALVLQVDGELPSSLTIFLQGDGALAQAAVFGDGVRCVAGVLLRLYVRSAASGSASAPQPGEPSITQRSAAFGMPIDTGSLRWYQAYYRDPSATFCTGATFNATNALRVAW
ncbi:MAG: PD40 domain-containing protein [Planctomycetes bacterium]|nr:PD40 domain-containing protein [Planctomycetota bacterium]